MSWRAVRLGLGALVVLAGCRGPSSIEQREPEPTPTGATSVSAGLIAFECGEDLPDHARCGDYEVYEDRAARAGRRIALRVVVLPATGPGEREDDPVFVLAGGPGQAASELVVLAHTQLRGVNRARDIVFVDQRGTGASNPLRCTASALPDMLEGIHAASQRETLDACRASWDADLRHYGTTEAMADLDEQRAALGYAQINLWGISYGTRAALEYLRRHEPSVRAVLLWGIAPPHQPYPRAFSAASEAALDQLFEACAADASCASILPDARARFDATLARLDAEPAVVELLDPRSGQLHEVEVDRQLFTTGVRLVLYDAHWSAQLPLMLAAADEGDLRPLMSFVVEFVIQIYAHIYSGMYLAVACSEDVDRIEPEDVREAAASRFGDRALTELLDVCEGWPRTMLAPDWAEPVRSDVPVLLMNGAVDPATPPAAAHAAAQTLGRARVVEFANVAHGTSNAEDCVNEIIRAFLDDPDPEGVDVGCASEQLRPPFATPGSF